MVHAHKTSKEELGLMMTGALDLQHFLHVAAGQPPHRRLGGGGDDLQLAKVNFYIRGGEILGVAGIAGCGQKELCEAIAGLRPIESGMMIHKGDNIVGLPPKAILEKGISMSFIPEDRLGMGLAPSMSVTDNIRCSAPPCGPP